MANRGHRIHLAPHWEKSWIEEIGTGERMELKQVDGVSVQEVIVMPTEPMDFPGPALWVGDMEE